MLLGSLLAGGLLISSGDPAGLRIGGLAMAAPPAAGKSLNADEIRRQTEQIIARPEFRRVREKRGLILSRNSTAPREPSWLDRMARWIWDQAAAFMQWLRKLFNWSGAGLGFGDMLVWLVYLTLAAMAGWIIWILFKRVRQYVQDRRPKPAKIYEEGDAGIAPGELAADEYMRRAAELAQQGNYREAIAQLILGGKSHTERQGLIRYRRGLTHRDYLRALRTKPPQLSAFRTMVGVYEPICFGRRPAESQHYQTSIVGYETGFGHG